MADVTIAVVTTAAVNTRSADLVGAGTAITTGQTFEITGVKGDTSDLLIFVEETAGSTATFTFDPGVNPPSLLANATEDGVDIALAANDLRWVPLQPGQFIQADGDILGSLVGAGKLYAIRQPREE